MVLAFRACKEMALDYDEAKVDQAVLALLYLTLGEDGRAWKNFDWEAMNRLCEQGFIDNPRNKNKSVLLTEKGVAESERLFRKMFGR
jgi:hypothetical protein